MSAAYPLSIVVALLVVAAARLWVGSGALEQVGVGTGEPLGPRGAMAAGDATAARPGSQGDDPSLREHASRGGHDSAVHQDSTAERGLLALQRSPQRTSVTVLAEVADLLALALSSGCGLHEALVGVADVFDDPVRAHLRTVVAGLRWGLPPHEAWSAVPAAWEPMAAALAVADLAGIPPAEALRRAAEDLRAVHEHELTVAAARLGVRLVLPLGLTFLPAFALTTVVPVVIALAGQLVQR